MRYNERDVAYFARSPRGRDREGYLQKKGETNPSFKQRWFVLKGNVLFYFQSKSDQDPLGFILLENCSVSEARDEVVEFGLSITFGTPGSRSYLLLARDREDMLAWAAALQNASYVRARETMRQLRAEVERLKRLLGGGAAGEADATDPSKSSMDAGDREVDVPTMSPSAPHSPLRQMISDEEEDAAGDSDADDAQTFGRNSSDAQGLEAPGDDDDGTDMQLPQQSPSGVGSLLKSLIKPGQTPSLPPPTAAISTPVTAPVFASFVHDDIEPGSTIDVAFSATVTRSAEQKDTYDVFDFQILVTRFDSVVRDWVTVGRTEVATATEKTQQRQIFSVDFVVSVQLHNINQMQQFKIALLRIDDVENDKVRLWGEGLITSSEIMQIKTSGARPPLQLQSDGRAAEGTDLAGHVVLKPMDPVEDEDNRTLGAFTVCPITRVRFEYQQQTYRVTTETGRALRVRETIFESPWTFIVPIHYLRFLRAEEETLIRDLNSVPDHLPNGLDSVRKRQIELHCRLLSNFKNALANLEAYTGKSFRPSTSKKGEDMQFIALNCHIQNLIVSDGQQNGNFVYDCVTFGAACAHGYGFKKGGLRSLLEAQASRDLTDDDAKLSAGGAEPAVKEQRSSSMYSALKSMSTRMAGFMRDTSSSTGQPQAATVPSLFFGTNASSSLSATSLASEEPPAPRSVLPRSHNSYRSQRLAAVEAVVTFGSLVDDIRTAAKMDDKAARLAALDRARSQMYIAVHHILAQAQRIENISDEALSIAGRVSKTSWPTFYSAVQNVADGTLGTAAYESFITSLDALVRNFERLALLVQTELNANFVKEDACSLSHLSLRMRLAAVHSQALTALVSIFASNLSNRIMDQPYLEQLSRTGYLAHFESLLSTQGDENGMLEDMYVAVRELSTVRIRLALEQTVLPTGTPRPSQSFFDFQGTPDALVIVVLLPQAAFDLLPEELQAGKIIDVYPVIFTQGINEMQTVANAVGDTTLQDLINTQSFALLRLYIKNFRSWLRETGLLTSKFVELRTKQLEDTTKELQTAISNSKRIKNTEMLTLAERLTRLLNGGRLTSCKSAKDRTSMAITLEQVLLLRFSHKLSPDLQDTLRDAMRSQGVRLQNVKKNTGTARYAFNYLQTLSLPKMYRPPRGTGGGSGA